MPAEYVIDTCVLQKSNARITRPVARDSLFNKRVKLLEDIRAGRKIVVYSRRLLAEYERQIKAPRNDYVRAFFAVLDDPRRGLQNWSAWTGSRRDKARGCRFPAHDNHLLRTAIGRDACSIVTEEDTLVATDRCIYRELRVHIAHLRACVE